jgi:PAS domain S-box-containing protein
MARDDSDAARALSGELGDAELLRGVLATIDDQVLIVTPEGYIAATNRLGPGLTDGEVVGQNLLDFLASGKRAEIDAALRDVAMTGEQREIELTAIAKLEPAPYRMRIGPIRQQGAHHGFVIALTELAAVRGMQAELRESRDKLRIALAASHIGLWSWEAATDTVTWDAATMRVYGRTSNPKNVEEYLSLVHPDDRKLVKGHIARALERGEYPDLEYRIVRGDGEERWVLCRAEVTRDGSGAVVRMSGGIVDVSERRMMEDKLRQAQKMEALGELTAGLAHNFNNALMAILPNLEHAVKSATPETKALLRVAQQAAERAARLVSELMVFAGGQRASERRDEPLAAVVERAVELCRSTFSRQISVELSLSHDPLVLLMDATQLEHAVMNVCINARDALEGVHGRSPTLRVVVERVGAGHEELRGPAFKPERDHARVSISDNGLGMPEEVRRRIFEPFFTTKEIGKGTGLGLSTTYAVVREHNGFINCESQPGAGTTFRIYLPIERSGKRKDSGTLQLPAPGGSEVVLLVDDDPVVRGVTARVLSSAGYRILEACDGSKGLSLFESQHGSIDLILLDESMPGIAGHEVLARILERDPNVRVAMFTGVQPRSELVSGARGMIRKPIGANELLWRVRQIIEN